MKNRNDLPSTFNLQSLIAAAVPSYVLPALMSFIPGYLLQKPELMLASYTSIGLSSLVATILSFIILWYFESREILVHSKSVRSLLVILLMFGMATLCVCILRIPSERFNIVFSACLGATIVTIRQQLKNDTDEKK